MKVKRYFSHSMQDALRQIREDLGPDAVILSNSKQGGGVEILATAEYEESYEVENALHGGARQQSQFQLETKSASASSSASSSNSKNVKPLLEEMARKASKLSPTQPDQPFEDVRSASASQQRHAQSEQNLALQEELSRTREKISSVKHKRDAHRIEDARRQDEKDSALDSAPSAMVTSETAGIPELHAQTRDTAIISMQEELRELRSLIAAQSKNVAQSEHQTDAVSVSKSRMQSELDERLESLGIQKPLRTQLSDRLANEQDADTAWAKARKQLHSAIQTEYGEIIDMGGVISLVGPTGSGKTMTIGKLAARYVMRHGADSLALVTTDRYRVAAHEQLKVFGRILNVPVHVVDEEHCLDAILDECSDRKLVLVDTAGLMQSDRSWNEQLKELKMSAHRIQNYLVMPATGQYGVMKANYKNYKIVGLAGTIITKLDEAVSLGEALSYLIASKLSCAYITDGQRVPEDIHLAKREDLLNKAEQLLNSSERWVTIRDQDSAAQNADYALSDFA